MSLDDDIRARSLTGADLWRGVQARTAAGAGYIYPYASQPSPSPPASPRQPPRVLVSSLLRTPNQSHATNAARVMSEFVSAQQEKLRQRPKHKRHPYSLPPIDSRLWLDEQRYAAWTIDGHLVSIEDRLNLPPLVRLITEDDRRQLFAVNRLIDIVIKLYSSDSLENARAVTRYMAHNDLEAALRAALARALVEEQRLAEAEARQEAELAEVPRRDHGERKKKSRFDPLGNFVLYSPSTIDLPPFAIMLPLGIPKAFESKRKAERFITKESRRGQLPTDCKIARVCASARVRPVFRRDVPIPRQVEKRIELLRKEPRIVEPELEVQWLPRFWQNESREWEPERFRNARTVRHGHRDVLRANLRSTATTMAQAVEEMQVHHAVTGSLGVQPGFAENVLRSKRLAQRAERILPREDRKGLNLPCDDFNDWSTLNGQVHSPPPTSGGHWLRAPFETGEQHADGLRSRLYELRIPDLAGLLERFGMTLTFWLIKDATTRDARWVLPVSIADLGA